MFFSYFDGINNRRLPITVENPAILLIINGINVFMLNFMLYEKNYSFPLFSIIYILLLVIIVLGGHKDEKRM